MEPIIDDAEIVSGETTENKNNFVVGEEHYDFSMLYVNNKLTFGALARITLKEKDDEVETSGFFSKASKPDENIKMVTSFMFVEPDGKTVRFINTENKKESSFLVDGSGSPTFDMYSEEIAKAIKKDIGKFKGFLKKQPTNVVTNIANLESNEVKSIVNSDKFKDTVETCIKQYELMMKGIEAERKKNGNIGLDEFLERYSFKKHTLLVGKAGVSKTFTATKWVDEAGYESEFIAGHSGLESIDLLGYWIKNSVGELVWLDGALTAAFRKAKKEKVVLLFDELLRVPSRELSILVGALTPDSSGHYRLRTNRLIGEKDGVGETETIVIPQENLHVIGTTNIGADFDVENIDVALQDRFRTHEVTMATNTIHEICTQVNNGKFPDKTIDSLVDLYEKIKLLVESNELTRELSLRHLTETISMADDVKDISSFMQDLYTIVCSRDTSGKINLTEERIYKSTVKKSIR